MDQTHLKRWLTGIVIAGVVGYSRLMGVDEEDTHPRLTDYVEI